ncbi:hypothetical protein PVAP13_1KG290605 [Panicum virgatum]|uniref:Uncharacterized protein n=1 Tax=Panicum virgatum TaxID=38727 RepID=A0A8T0XT63_PANVG|nr:hypothetical protein PVAP13_1KG290605 [Panicum virgatum]
MGSRSLRKKKNASILCDPHSDSASGAMAEWPTAVVTILLAPARLPHLNAPSPRLVQRGASSRAQWRAAQGLDARRLITCCAVARWRLKHAVKLDGVVEGGCGSMSYEARFLALHSEKDAAYMCGRRWR